MRNLKLAALISTCLLLPFIVLEWINRQQFAEGFPIPLFAAMWLLAAASIFVLLPVMRTRSAAGLIARVVVGVCVAWLWVALVQDQLPCFLGVPNCD